MSGLNEIYIFRHPNLRMRKEKFGGLVQSEKGLFLLGSTEFNTLSSFRGYKTRREAEKILGVKLLKKSLDLGLFLKIERELADSIIKRNGGKSNEEQIADQTCKY